MVRDKLYKICWQKLTNLHQLETKINLDRRALKQVTACALEAWRSLPQGRESTASLSNIKQEQKSPMKILCQDWLRSPQNHSNKGAAETLIKQLTFWKIKLYLPGHISPCRTSGDRRLYQTVCRCRASNDKGRCHSCSHKKSSYQQGVQSFFAGQNCGPGQIQDLLATE